MFADFAKWPLEVLSLVSTESHCRKPSPERCHGPPGPCGQAVWRPQTPLVPSGTMLALVPFASATLGSLGPCACCSLRKGPVLASSPAAHRSDRSPIAAVSRNPPASPQQASRPSLGPHCGRSFRSMRHGCHLTGRCMILSLKCDPLPSGVKLPKSGE